MKTNDGVAERQATPNGQCGAWATARESFLARAPGARLERVAMTATGVELHVDAVASDVLGALETERQVWVVGDPGSGRHTLARRLADARRSSVIVDLLDPRDADAAIGGFYAAAAELPRKQDRLACLRDWSSLHEAVNKLHERAGDDLTVIAVVPHSWATEGAAQDDWEREAGRRSQQLLHGLADSRLQVVWLTSRTMRPEQLGNESLPRPYALKAPTNTLALLATVDWGAYSTHAHELESKLPADVEPLPFTLRLAVGVVGLGGDAASIAQELVDKSTGEVLRSLVDELIDRLKHPDLASCRHALARLLLARRALPAQDAVKLTGVPEEHEKLLTSCVGYGDELVRVSPAVRKRFGAFVRETLDRDAERDMHANLAGHFALSDGAPTIGDTKGLKTLAWLEKKHHEVRSADSVDLSQLPCRELYWARARYLSKVKRDFEAAAQAYQACSTKFPDDSYASHYLAYNLERAGLSRTVARGAYQKAVELDATNPWWNSRNVTFLLGQGQTDLARAAWRKALDNVDPEGERVERDPWLAEHMHHWVARAWLEVGEVSQALSVLRGIPDAMFSRSTRLAALRQAVLDAVEADALGDSVYPRSFDVDERWRRAYFLERDLQGDDPLTWFPGRVTHADSTHVLVLYGARLEDGRYESKVADIDASSWKEIGFGSAAAATGFVELGVYADGSKRIVPFEDSAEPPLTNELPLAYFDRWR